MRVIPKVASGELLTKRAIRTIIMFINTYILKTILIAVKGGTEAFVSGNKTCMSVSPTSAACELSLVLTPYIRSSLLLKGFW
jgi:hypothetical protein